MTQFGKAVSISYGSASSSSIQRAAEAEFVGQPAIRASKQAAIEPSETEEAKPTDGAEARRPPLQVPLGEILMRSLAGQDTRPRKGTSGLGFMLNCR